MNYKKYIPTTRRGRILYGVFLSAIAAMLIITSLGIAGREILPAREYLAWLANPDNGILKTQYGDGLKISVRYLPPELRAWRDLDGRNTDIRTRDSLVDYYRKSRSFLLSIGPDEREKEGKDIMTGNVRSYGEFSERVMQLNFGLQDMIRLKTETGEFAPVLANLENVYGLTSHRKVFLVFADTTGKNSLLKAEDFTLTWNDNVFSSGTHRFHFTRSDLESIPELLF